MTPTAPPARKPRTARHAVVARTEWLTPSMVRVVLTGDDLRELPELPFTDHYVKLLFPPAGADYSWPFDPEQVRAERPAEEWPVTRTYTIRSWDPDKNELAIDFVVHGDRGLAGPWAQAAAPGDRIAFFGPGGAYAPEAEADVHLLAGDEAALPAIAAALDRLPDGARAEVWLEVDGAEHEQPLTTGPDVTVHWVHRDQAGRDHGHRLAREVRAAGLPAGRLQAFVHGNADLVRDLRRFLFVDSRVPRSQVSISGYWRTGQDEDLWQATKGEFVASMENEENEQSAAS